MWAAELTQVRKEQVAGFSWSWMPVDGMLGCATLRYRAAYLRWWRSFSAPSAAYHARPWGVGTANIVAIGLACE